MNRQLTVVLVAVVAVVAVGGGAALFTDQNGGADAPAAPNDASAAVEESTPTPQSNEPTNEPTEQQTPTEADDGGDDGSPSSAEATVTETPTEPPVARAGANRTVREWVRVHFDATRSTDPDGNDANLSYQWTQVGGPNVNMAGEDTATPNFLAPDVSERTNYTFVLTVTDEDGATATDRATITVRLPKLEGDTNDRTETETPSEPKSDDDSDDDSVPDGEEQSPSSNDDDDAGDDSDTGDDSNADDGSSATTRDDIAESRYGTTFDALNAEQAAVVEEFYMRHAEGDWDPSTLSTRDELAQEAYGSDYDELEFDARVDVQETFDAQFGDTGGALSKDDISQAKWGYDFENLSVESAGQITELYDRQPWEDRETQHVRTREQWAHRLYDDDVSDLTREERLEVERRYHNQFAD